MLWWKDDSGREVLGRSRGRQEISKTVIATGDLTWAFQLEMFGYQSEKYTSGLIDIYSQTVEQVFRHF